MKTFFYATALLIPLAEMAHPSQAMAEYWSDNDLSTYCKASDGTLEKGACIKGGVSIGQLVDTVTHFLTATHDIKHGSANSLVASVLADAFPCK